MKPAIESAPEIDKNLSVAIDAYITDRLERSDVMIYDYPAGGKIYNYKESPFNRIQMTLDK